MLRHIEVVAWLRIFRILQHFGVLAQFIVTLRQSECVRCAAAHYQELQSLLDVADVLVETENPFSIILSAVWPTGGTPITHRASILEPSIDFVSTTISDALCGSDK